MPTLKVNAERIQKELEMSEERISDLLFDYGLELDEIVFVEGQKEYKIDIPANRYDLLCFNGLCNALKIFLKVEEPFKLKITKTENKIFCESRPKNKRKYVLSAIIEDIGFTEDTYADFINYQEMLHKNLGRDRKFISMGTHNADVVQFPLKYEHRRDLSFKPLNKEVEVNVEDLKPVFKDDKKMLNYFDYVDDENCIFVDYAKKIISFPPIINADFCKISKDTKNVLLEITGTDFFKVSQAMSLMLSNFGKNKKIGSVEVIYEEKGCKKILDKNLKVFLIRKDEIEKELGIKLEILEIKDFLNRMMHKVEIIDENNLEVEVLDSRQDILHKIDLIEDIAVAYGFNNFKDLEIKTSTIGKPLFLNKMADFLRFECAFSSFVEVLNLTLLSRQENDAIRPSEVSILNPNSSECEVLRSSLFPGLLKTVKCNQHLSVPLKIFEVGDVTFKIGDNFENKKKLAALIAGNSSNFEEIQGLCSRILLKLGLKEIKYKESENRIFFKKRSAEIFVENKKVGIIGVLDPKILEIFKVPFVCTSFELNVESLASLI